MDLLIAHDWMLVRGFSLALGQIVGHNMPSYLFSGCRWHPNYNINVDISCDVSFELQGWAASNCPNWMTGFGCIEAAEIIVESSIENDLNAFVRSMEHDSKAFLDEYNKIRENSK